MFKKATTTEQLMPDHYVAILKVENSSVSNLTFGFKINQFLKPVLQEGFEDFPNFPTEISSHATGKITEWSSNYWLGFYPKDSSLMGIFAVYEISKQNLPMSRDFINDLVINSKHLTNTYSVSGHDIWEIKEKNKSHFLAEIDNKILYSNTKDLLSSALLNVVSEKFSEFRRQKEVHATEVHLEPITLFVNYRELQKVHFGADFLNLDQKYFSTFADFGVLEIKENNNNLFLHGFSYVADTSVSFLSTLEGQSEQEFSHFNMIPQKSVFVSYLNLNLLQEYIDKLQVFDHFHFATEKELNDERQKLVNQLKSTFDNTAIYTVFQNPLGEYDRVVLLKKKASDGLISLKDFQVEFEFEGKNQTELIYKDKKIVKLTQNGVINTFFGNSHKPFESCYYTEIDGYLVFSDQVQSLYGYINTLLSEKTWKFDLQHDYYNDDQILASTSGWIFDFDNVKNPTQKFSCAIFQFGGAVRNKMYTSIKLFPSSEKRKVLVAQEVIEQTIPEKTEVIPNELYADFDTDLTENIFLIHNYASKEKEVVVQDINNKIYCLTLSGEKAWEQRLDGPIISPIYQIDVLKNNKEQYIFATEKKVYCIDRLGQMVSHFPQTFKFPIHGFQLVDYDGSKNYRFLMTSEENAYLSDARGNLLPGWKPNKLSEKPIIPLTFVRSGKKDFFIEISKNGKIQFINRMGKVVSTSKLNTTVYPQFVFDHEGAKTDVVVLSDKGTLYKISPTTTHKLVYSSGKETSQGKLLLDVASDKFRIAIKNKLYDENFGLLFSYEGTIIKYRNVNNTGFVITKVKDDKLEIFTEKGVKVAHSEIEYTDNIEILALGNKYVAVGRYKSEVKKFELEVN